MNETIPTMEKFKQEQDVNLNGVEIFSDNGYSSPANAEYYEKEGAIAYIPDEVTAKEIHGRENKITKFNNDYFKLDFEKNQAICPQGHIMKFCRVQRNRKNVKNWVNIYKTDQCKNCPSRMQCVPKGNAVYREARINPSMRKIRLRFKEEEGMKKYNPRFHKGEVAQAHILYNLGYREFRCRGIESCENEVNFFSTAYNLIKIYKRWKENKENFGVSNKKYFLMSIYAILNVNYNTA